MYLPSFLRILTSVTLLLQTLFAAPTKNVHHPARTSSADAKRQLQVLVDVAVIINAAQTVAEGIEAIIDTIDGDIHEAEGEFTQGIVSNLRDQYPTMEVLVFHIQDCGYDLFDVTHGFTQGYEVWVFDHGTVNSVGDGGYENWAIGGSFDGPSSDVTFYSMNGN